jgi:hypothetical protein
MAAATRIMTTAPPTTPPAIAPAFDFREGEGGVRVGVLVEDVDVDVELAEVDDTSKSC